MKELLEKNNLLKSPQVGKIVEGKVIGKGRSAIFLDLGALGTGIIYGKEFKEAKDELKNFKIGDNIFTKIIDLENEDGYIELSLTQASSELTWEQLRQKQTKGEQISIKILGANKGGLLTEISGIPGFLPVSQLLPEHYPRVEKGETSKILTELQKFIGKELKIKIFDLNQRERKLILSEKAKEDEKKKEILKKYKVGDVVEVKIIGITDFGAFISFPVGSSVKESEKLEGLIHISELDWQLIEDPAEIVRVDQNVKAKIIEISDDKISLSLKALKQDPWKKISTKFKKGNVIEGEVTKFNIFGAFVKITPKIQGLCHISEFGIKSKMEEKLKIGEKYNFQILSIDTKAHRMTLKLIGKQ